MSALKLSAIVPASHAPEAGVPWSLAIHFLVAVPVAFDVDVSIDIVDRTNAQVSHAQLRAAGSNMNWLPRGDYVIHALAPGPGLPPGRYVAHVALWHRDTGKDVKCGDAVLEFEVLSGAGSGPQWSWQLHSDSVSITALSWKRGPQDWFYKHFGHAAITTASYLLGDSPLLKGRVLDVGCGDGVTDLGIALRTKPEEFIGIDPFRGYERLPEILREAQLPQDCVPQQLRFLAADANAIPFADDYFDVVVSWGSLEHIAGGYSQALSEIRRVLRPGGLLMVHPGLYYSDVGNHLGEFRFAREEPYVHLKRPREWLRKQVLQGDIERMERSGYEAAPAEYWQWFTELNPIRVAQFEQELRALGFEPWRVALRTHDRVDYTPELQSYSFVDLAVGELYVSAYNRKPARNAFPYSVEPA